MFNVTKIISLVTLFTFSITLANSQSINDPAYRNLVNERSVKIVKVLGILDSVKFFKIRDIIAEEYVGIRRLDEKMDEQLSELSLRSNNITPLSAEKENIQTAIEKERRTLNADFIQSLTKHLNPQQVEKVKDGLTYGMFHPNYHVFLEMIPSLKDQEKIYICQSLLEAREIAMTAGSSKAKEGIFEEHRMEIIKYLTRQGYNLKEERKKWYARKDLQF